VWCTAASLWEAIGKGKGSVRRTRKGVARTARSNEIDIADVVTTRQRGTPEGILSKDIDVDEIIVSGMIIVKTTVAAAVVAAVPEGTGAEAMDETVEESGRK